MRGVGKGFSAEGGFTLYLRLTWKCEVGAQLGLKWLIWGYVVCFKGFDVKSCGFRGWVGVLECPQRDTNP